MSSSIGDYVREKLRSKKISNKIAGESIGISESAFEKVLRQDDIYPSRLMKLSTLCDANLLEYYNDQEPIKSFVQKDKEAWQSKVDQLTFIVAEKNKRILDQEDIIRLLKEKEEYLNSAK